VAVLRNWIWKEYLVKYQLKYDIYRLKTLPSVHELFDMPGFVLFNMFPTSA
jgi:hypothetical protein